jgi:hypothetical protein
MYMYSPQYDVCFMEIRFLMNEDDTVVAKYYTLNYSLLVHVHHDIFKKEHKILGT